MSKADAADSDSTVRKHRQRGLIPWKPGQSGNPKGRPKGSRHKIQEEFLRDYLEAWLAFGKPALMTAALTDPVAFVRVGVMLLPREVEPTITTINADRMTDDELQTLSIVDAASSMLEAAQIIETRRQTRNDFTSWCRLYGVEPARRHRSECRSPVDPRPSSMPPQIAEAQKLAREWNTHVR